MNAPELAASSSAVFNEVEGRHQMEQLQAQLSTRASTLHFAHAAVAMVVALIVAGAAAKLSWDSFRHWYLGAGVGALSAIVCGYSLRHYVVGKRYLLQELERFELLKALRRQLRVDDPSALLPQ